MTRFVAAKRRPGWRTPYLYWRMLEFPWNRHETETARALAASMDVDKFGVELGVMPTETNLSQHPRRAGEPERPPSSDTREIWQRMARRRSDESQYFGCD